MRLIDASYVESAHISPIILLGHSPMARSRHWRPVVMARNCTGKLIFDVQDPRMPFLLARRSAYQIAVVVTIAFSLFGCSSSTRPDPSATADAVSVNGNWSFASTAPQAVGLPQIAGSLSGTGEAITGLFHAASVGACVDAKSLIAMSGSADANGNLALTSTPFGSGSVLSIRGLLAEDGKSISKVSYSVTGGACAFSQVSGSTNAQAAATQYEAISGSYAGSFVDSEGNSLPVTATLTQTSQPDANGTFHLSGSADFASGNCIDAPVVTDSLVTGSSLSATYTQTDNGVTSTVVGSGTFNADATVLTITNWTLSGGCGADTGTGVLTKQ